MQTNYVIRAFQSKFYPQIIHKKGLDFLSDLGSIYSWDSVSDKILMQLIRRY